MGKYLRTKHRNRKDKCFLIRHGQSEQNILIWNKTPTKNVFPNDVERTVNIFLQTVWILMRWLIMICLIRNYTVCHFILIFWMRPLIGTIVLTRIKDERVHFRNSGMKGYLLVTWVYLLVLVLLCLAIPCCLKGRLGCSILLPLCLGMANLSVLRWPLLTPVLSHRSTLPL